MRQAPFHFSLELVAMTAVIAISSWHVGNYMNTFDGWLMATIMGATLGFCNFLMAHNIFKPNTTTRFPSFCGLVFFACTSTYMQYTYFNANSAIGKTLVMGINLDALALGSWAPAAEILLGWIYAAGLQATTTVERPRSVQPSKFERLAEALTGRLEQKLNTSPNAPVRSIEQPALRDDLPEQGQMSAIATVQQSTIPYHLNGQIHEQHLPSQEQFPPVSHSLNGQMEPLNVQLSTNVRNKDEALEQILNIYRVDPTASYDDIGRRIGRSKGTVANYVKVLKQRQQIRIMNGKVEVLV
ncbi:MAG: winged helix-turn-helix domain-containing protein [Caldilineaceae bacterium]